MPTEKPVITFAVDAELMKRIDDYRFSNRINTRSEAIRRLVEAGLMQNQNKKPK